MPINYTQRDPNAFYKGAEFEQQNKLTQLAMQNQQQDRATAAEDRQRRITREDAEAARLERERDREKALRYIPFAQSALQSPDPRQFIASALASPLGDILRADGVFDDEDLEDPELPQTLQAFIGFAGPNGGKEQQRVQSTFVGKNGNMWVVDATGKTRDTGTPVSQFAQRPVEAAGGVYSFDPARGALGAPLATPEQQRTAAAAEAGAVAGARATAENTAANTQAATQNNRAYETYLAGISNVEKRLNATQTDPITGRAIALTANAQAAEGAIAAMAPVLKGLFRQAGEGTFTDRDQALLIEMLPTRKDHPEARKAKIESINAIVRAKLGMGSSQAAPEASQAPTATGPNGQKLILKNGKWVPLGQ